MKVSPETIRMIKHHEGVRRKPYRCPAHLWTVGVGHVLYPEQAKLPVAERLAFPLKVEDFRIWSDAEVDDLLAKDLARFERGVARLCPNSVGAQGRFDGLVSFAFNVGLGNLQRSSLRMKNNRGDFEGAAEEFMKWTKAAGKVLPGLVKRRLDEQRLYLS
jgi:GH24 family phage-related lysozyme (muramidase)